MSQVAIANPWVWFDSITESWVCDRCRNRQACRDRFAEVVISIGEHFLATHRTCRSKEEMFPAPDRKDLE